MRHNADLESSRTRAASPESGADSGTRLPPTRSSPSLRPWTEMGAVPAQRPPLSGPSSFLYAVEPAAVPRPFPPTAAPQAFARPVLPRGSWWRYLRRTLLPWEWRLLVMGGGAGIAACCLGHLSIPWYFAVLMDGICGGEMPTGTSSQLMALFVVVFVGQVIQSWSVRTTESSVSARLRRELYDTILSHPQMAQEEKAVRTPQTVEGGPALSTSSLVQRLSLDSQQVSQSLTLALSALAYHALFGMGAVGMMLLLSPPLTFAIVGVFIPGLIFSGVYGRHYHATQRSSDATRIALKAVAEERLAWKAQIQLWHTQEKESAWFAGVVGRHLIASLRHQRWGAVYGATVNLVAYGGCLCMIWAGSLVVASQRLTHGGLLAMVVYTLYGMWSAIGAVQRIHEINKGYASWIRLWEVMCQRENLEKKEGVCTDGVPPHHSSVPNSSTGPTSPLSCSPASSSLSSSRLLDVSLHHIVYPSAPPFSSSSSSLLLRDVTCPLFPPSARPSHRPCVTCVVSESPSTLSAVAAVLLQRFPPTLECAQRRLLLDTSETTGGIPVEAKKGSEGDATPTPKAAEDHANGLPRSTQPSASAVSSHSRASGPPQGDARDRQKEDYPKEKRYRYGTFQLPQHSSSPAMILQDPVSFPRFFSAASSEPPPRSTEVPPVWTLSYLGPVHTTMVLEGSVKDNILYGTSDGEWGGHQCPAAASFSSLCGAPMSSGRPLRATYPAWMKRETGVGAAVMSLMRHDAETGMSGKDHWQDTRVVEAAMKAGAHAFVTNELLQGYDTMLLGRRRPAWCSLSHPLFSFSPSSSASFSDLTVLSDGQTQLLGLSRALLRQPAILVLDQPTNALDNALSYAVVLSAVQNICSPAAHPLISSSGTPSASSSRPPLQKAARTGYPQGILLCSNDRSLVHLAQHIIVLGNDTNDEGGATVVAQGSIEDVKHHPVFCRAVR